MEKESITSNDFRYYLRDGFESRKRANPSLTMRAYAEEIGISPQMLNQVLAGKFGLSAKSARSIAERLKLSEQESSKFQALVQSRHERSRLARETSAEQLVRLNANLDFDVMSDEGMKKVNTWKHIALLILTDRADFKFEEAWIAEKLKTDSETVAGLLEDLFESGLVYEAEPGVIKRDTELQAFKAGTPSKIMQDYYAGLLERAEDALRHEEYSMRDFSASVISVSESDMEFVKAEVEMFRRSLIAKISNRPGAAERVCAVSIQVFPLDQK